MRPSGGCQGARGMCRTGRGARGRRQGLTGLRDDAQHHQYTRHRRCGGRRRARRARAGFEIDHSEPSGSRVAISRAAGPDGARNTRGATQHRTNTPRHTKNRHPDRMSACGGARGIRTPDLLIANETRYQLRHSPKDSNSLAPSQSAMQADHRRVRHDTEPTHARPRREPEGPRRGITTIRLLLGASCV